MYIISISNERKAATTTTGWSILLASQIKEKCCRSYPRVDICENCSNSHTGSVQLKMESQPITYSVPSPRSFLNAALETGPIFVSLTITLPLPFKVDGRQPAIFYASVLQAVDDVMSLMCVPAGCVSRQAFDANLLRWLLFWLVCLFGYFPRPENVQDNRCKWAFEDDGGTSSRTRLDFPYSNVLVPLQAHWICETNGMCILAVSSLDNPSKTLCGWFHFHWRAERRYDFIGVTAWLRGKWPHLASQWSSTLTGCWWASHLRTLWDPVVWCFPQSEARSLPPSCLLAIFDNVLPTFSNRIKDSQRYWNRFDYVFRLLEFCQRQYLWDWLLWLNTPNNKQQAGQAKYTFAKSRSRSRKQWPTVVARLMLYFLHSCREHATLIFCLCRPTVTLNQGRGNRNEHEHMRHP